SNGPSIKPKIKQTRGKGSLGPIHLSGDHKYPKRTSPPMAGKGGAALSTYSPSPTTQKTKSRIFGNDDVDWVRSDGREFHQCRPAFFKTGAVNAAAGSAYAEFGNTKVIVSVFGPRESKKAMMYSDIGRLNCNVSYATFATPVRGQGSDHKEFSSMLHKALEGAIILETFPKTTVDVFALVLESGGSDLPVVISCASLALADAGIMMYDLVTSVSVVRFEFSTLLIIKLKARLLSGLGKNLVIDPILEEESYQDGSLMLTCMPSRYEVTQLTITGNGNANMLGCLLKTCSGDLPVVISCASLALADAGIMMYDLVTSVSVSYLGKNLVLDPTLEEESHQDGSLILTCMPSRDEVTQLAITGEWSTPKINEGMKICMDACSKFSRIMKSCLKGLDSALEEEDSNFHSHILNT
ncbi:3'-5'-exoribonuclease family protein, partial [Prunus dulcis]